MFQMTHTMTARRLLAAAMLLLGAAPAWAGCSVNVQPMAFGAYQAAQTGNLDASFNVTFQCDLAGLFPTYTFSAGRSGNANARRMSNGLDNLQYQLYADAARTQVLTGGSTFVFFNRTVTYYGRIAGNQDVSPGAYSDSITVTVTP